MSSSKICPFCDPTQEFRYIIETPGLRVLYPKNPAIAYHVLITPKRHVKHLDDLSAAESAEFFGLLQKVTKTAEAKLGSNYLGFNMLSNNGDPSINQQVPHAHMHLFLRTRDDKVDPFKTPHQKVPQDFTPEQLEDLAQMKTWFSK